MSKPILCLDFDGVIHSYTSGWQGADVIPDPPVDGAREFIRNALSHFTVVIFSSRSDKPGGLKAMRKWMDTHAIDPFHEVEFPLAKPPALVTIDDRAITFSGVWPDMEELLKFKPWNKK